MPKIRSEKKFIIFIVFITCVFMATVISFMHEENVKSLNSQIFGVETFDIILSKNATKEQLEELYKLNIKNSSELNPCEINSRKACDIKKSLKIEISSLKDNQKIGLKEYIKINKIIGAFLINAVGYKKTEDIFYLINENKKIFVRML